MVLCQLKRKSITSQIEKFITRKVRVRRERSLADYRVAVEIGRFLVQTSLGTWPRDPHYETPGDLQVIFTQTQ